MFVPLCPPGARSAWLYAYAENEQSDLTEGQRKLLSIVSDRAAAAIKGELVKVDQQVDQLVKDMNRSIAEADKFIQTMEKESD